MRAAAHFGIRRRLATGLGLLVALVLGAGCIVLGVAARYRTALDALDHDVALARRARALGVSAREQYIHEAHTIILGDRSHVGHHGEWVATFRAGARALRDELPPRDHARLNAIVASSAALDAVFASDILPAIDRGDRAAVRRAHDRAEAIVAAMISGADALGELFEQRARDAARRAEADARVGVAASVALALLAALVALAVTRGVWGGVAAPLARLQRVAERVAGGDTAARVGALPPRELAVVGGAFDQMLDRLAQREAELVHAERLAVVGRIAAGVAHEINNPIGVIRGYLKTMLAETEDSALRDELAILDEEALACQRIAEDLLAYARVPALDRRPTDVAALVAEAVVRLRATGELAGCDVTTEVEPATLHVDPLRLRQVVTNLVRNGAQASARDGDDAAGATLEVRGEVRGDRYEIRVADRGPGIAPEVRAHLFEPFATNRAGGTGLGLAVCEGIVRTHGGEITAEDRPGGGTVFVVRLPADPTAASPPGAAGAAPEGARA